MDGFYWAPGTDPKTWRGFRVPRDGDRVRDVAEIALPELANAAEAEQVRRLLGTSRDGLVRATAQLFGIHRVGRVVRERMEQAIALLAAEGRCKLDGERVGPV